MKKIIILLALVFAFVAFSVAALVILIPLIYPKALPKAALAQLLVAPPPPPTPESPSPDSPIVIAMCKAHPDYLVISSVDAVGNIEHKTDVIYPDYAMSHRIQGTVVMFAAIDENGSVVDLIYSSGNDLLKGAALDGVRHYKYKPFLINGKPTGVITTIHFVFNLGL